MPFNLSLTTSAYSVILLQIVVFSPTCRTHLVETHESLSLTNEWKKKTGSLKLKMLGPLCNQTVTCNLETAAKTLYYSLLKLKYSLSIYSKHKKD